jgi:hypothetical protein
MTIKLNIKCLLIEPAEELIKLLIKPKTSIIEINDKNTLYSKWIHNCIDLYNNRTEFLLLANTKICGSNLEIDTLNKPYIENYKLMNKGFEKITYNKCSDENIFIDLYENNKEKIDTKTEEYDSDLEYTIFRLIIFMFQYLHTFEDKSININLWNYSLKSCSISQRCFIIGIFTLLSQYVMIGCLLYHLMINFEANYDTSIILITIFSTIISLLYSYDTFNSFWNSIPLYRFLILIYKEYPELQLSSYEKNLLYYKNRNINMTLNHIIFNFIADMLSNGLLPIMIPFINIFIILNSENVVESILNSIAIFFIIQIDEELYTVTDYESDKKSINFLRWVVSVIYCKHFPEYERIFKLEMNGWQNRSLKISKKYKHCNRNKIDPNKIIINIDKTKL